MEKRYFGVSYIVFFWIALGFIIFPMINTLLKSFETGGGVFYKNYIDYFANINNLRVVFNTFKMGIFTVLVCGIIGTILALYIGFVEFRFRNHNLSTHNLISSANKIRRRKRCNPRNKCNY